MATCLYCQHDNSTEQSVCENCGMNLPQNTERNQERRLLRFKWFVFGLVIFCAIMIVWLPRSNPAGG